MHQSKYGEEEQTEDTQNLSYHERILEQRRKEVETLTISREKIRAERAVRAQRRLEN